MVVRFYPCSNRKHFWRIPIQIFAISLDFSFLHSILCKLIIYCTMYILVLISYCLLPAFVAGSSLPTHLTGNVKLYLTSSPYFITSNSLLDTGNSLFIEAGVTIYFSQNSALLIRGSLIANGTASNWITFSAVNSLLPWGNLQIMSNSSQLNYCKFLFGGNNVSSSL